jgi:hypothetical protein
VTVDWPTNADGDVFRRLQSQGFDFTIPHKIDFQIDFDAWPPSNEAIATLKRKYQVERYEPELDSPGYIQITLFALLTYDFVIDIQGSLSRQLSPFGGVCEAWGVLS